MSPVSARNRIVRSRGERTNHEATTLPQPLAGSNLTLASSAIIKSPDTNQVAHQASAHLWFLWYEVTRSISTPPRMGCQSPLRRRNLKTAFSLSKRTRRFPSTIHRSTLVPRVSRLERPLDQGRFPFDQNLRKFLEGERMEQKFSGISFRNFGCTSRGLPEIPENRNNREIPLHPIIPALGPSFSVSGSNISTWLILKLLNIILVLYLTND